MYTATTTITIAFITFKHTHRVVQPSSPDTPRALYIFPNWKSVPSKLPPIPSPAPDTGKCLSPFCLPELLNGGTTRYRSFGDWPIPLGATSSRLIRVDAFLGTIHIDHTSWSPTDEHLGGVHPRLLRIALRTHGAHRCLSRGLTGPGAGGESCR